MLCIALVDFEAKKPESHLAAPVIGTRPSGLIAGLLLAQMGFRLLILERSKAVRKRTRDTWDLWRKRNLHPESNVQFGEGGAGIFFDGEDVSAHDTLVRLTGEAALDAERARQILTRGAYAGEVRVQQQFCLQHDIRSVPATIINDSHLISGGHPAEAFEQALRQITTAA